MASQGLAEGEVSVNVVQYISLYLILALVYLTFTFGFTFFFLLMIISINFCFISGFISSETPMQEEPKKIQASCCQHSCSRRRHDTSKNYGNNSIINRKVSIKIFLT